MKMIGKLLPCFFALAFVCLGQAKEKPTNFVVFLTVTWAGETLPVTGIR